MTEEEKEELEQELRHVKRLFMLHATDKILKNRADFEENINDLLDWAAELEKKLKK